jgi:hypothetical protein
MGTFLMWSRGDIFIVVQHPSFAPSCSTNSWFRNTRNRIFRLLSVRYLTVRFSGGFWNAGLGAPPGWAGFSSPIWSVERKNPVRESRFSQSHSRRPSLSYSLAFEIMGES